MEQQDRVYKWLKEFSAIKFEGSHSIHTPKEIVQSVVENLQTNNQNILVIFNVEFVLELIAQDVDPNSITFLSDHDVKTKMVNRLGVNRIIESLNNDMKNKINFDVIVGNPPFNDSAGDNRTESKNTNNSNLYTDFIKKCIDICPNGQISLITPAAWMQNDTIKEKVVNAGLKKIKEVDPKFFSGVGIRSGISVFFTEPNYNGTVEIETSGVTYNINRNSTFTFDNPKKYELINRLKQKTSFASLLKTGPYKIPKGTKGSIDRLLDKDSSFERAQSTEFSTEVIIYVGGKEAPQRTLFSNSNKSVNKWGVVVPTASDKFIIGAVRIIAPGVGVSDRLKVAYFATEAEATNAKAYLESKLIKFIIGTTKHNDTVNTNKNSFGNIPLVDFKTALTDADIFSKFNLTQEEINLVLA